MELGMLCQRVTPQLLRSCQLLQHIGLFFARTRASASTGTGSLPGIQSSLQSRAAAAGVEPLGLDLEIPQRNLLERRREEDEDADGPLGRPKFRRERSHRGDLHAVGRQLFRNLIVRTARTGSKEHALLSISGAFYSSSATTWSRQ